MEKSLKSESLMFSDVIGDFSALDSLAFLPTFDGIRNLKSMKEAATRLSILSSVVLSNTSVLTHGSIKTNYAREYIFFKSEDGIFDYRRVLKDKISQISIFNYMEVTVASFMKHELDIIDDKYYDFKKTGILDIAKPKIGVVFGVENKNETQSCIRMMYRCFNSLEILILLGESFKHIEYFRKRAKNASV